jgi:hypothetical protein
MVEVPLDKLDSDLDPFLTAAALVRSEDLSGSGLSSGRLDQIELYLAAHFFTVAIEHGGVIQHREGNSSEMYRTPSNTLTGFAATNFGQMAIAFDTSGTLVNLDSKKKAELSIVGRSGNRNERYPNGCQ